MTESKNPYDAEYLQFTWNSPEPLKICGTYAYQASVRYEDGMYRMKFIPIQITGKAKRGQYGERVACSDGINRYQAGPYRGRHRPDQYGLSLYYYQNPNFIPEMKPHVQLSLFDF